MTRFNFGLQRVLFYVGTGCTIQVAISFIYTPLITVLKFSFVADGTVSWVPFRNFSASDRVRHAISNTLLVIFFSVITVNVIGIFQVAVLEYIPVQERAILKVAYSLPLIFVSVVAATGYYLTYGQTGIVTRVIQSVYPTLPNGWFTGIFAVVFAHTFLLTSFYYLLYARPFSGWIIQ